ncbi:MAG TPA: HAD family hydrolase [Vicinamibacterales bacterium]|nr:HAD family hydrolase [Vicinamibacterales bacterium]
MRPAVFLDRDGTLIEEVGYLDSLERLNFFPFSVDAVRLLNRAGRAVVVVTNQSGVARGYFDEAVVAATHRHIADTLARGTAHVDGFYYCPHHPDGRVAAYRIDCDCRKPRPGLLRQAAQELNLDLQRSFVVGDRAHDIATGVNAGVRGVLVRTGYGRAHEAEAAPSAAAVTDNLAHAVSWILRHS